MQRCLQLAKLGLGRTAPNPMVGSVLVYNNRVIGEGYHEEYGKAHAEVNCIQSVPEEDKQLIKDATLYVSLEPCAHFGKTPPCTDLIIENKISKVVVGCRDPFPKVNGKGIEKLKASGIEVELGMLENECRELNKRFFTFHTNHRPYIILKWAQSLNNKIANDDRSRVFITNDYSNRLVHQWRSQEMAIMVGTNTALYDDPELTTRLWPGEHPVRVVVDKDLKLPPGLKLFNGVSPAIVFNLHKHTLPFEKVSATDLREMGLSYYRITEEDRLVPQILNALYFMNIQSVIIEGGAQLLQSFIDEDAWDEARVIANEELTIASGIAAPELKNQRLVQQERLLSDNLKFYIRNINH